MTAQHSPEPWEVAGDDSLRDAALTDVLNVYDCTAHVMLHADARRIVACVNACAGIPIEALEESLTEWVGAPDARLRHLSESALMVAEVIEAERF